MMTEAAPYSYEEAARIRREAKGLQPQLGRIISEARDQGKTATEIAYDLRMNESRVYQILRAHRGS